MASILAKHLGWSYSRTFQVFRQSGLIPYLTTNKQYAENLSTKSQFYNKSEKLRRQKIKLKYYKRINSLDPDHDVDMEANSYVSCNENPISRVYVWGLSCYGALGNPDLIVPRKTRKKISETMHKPIRCSLMEMERVIDIACGYGFTIFAVKGTKNQLYGTGLNKDGQIAYLPERKDHQFDVIIKPVPINLPNNSKVKNVAAGRSHTLALTEEGDVYSMGNNAYGQCGRPVIEDEDYQRSNLIHNVKIPSIGKNDKIIGVTCGMDHSIFRTSNGHLYSCGWGADGQTGLEHYNNEYRPTRIRGDIETEHIVKVSCAADCVLALNDKGEVFGWGNSEYGQFQTITDEQQLSTPTKLNLTSIGGKIKDIASGGTICMVLNEDHDVFVWGYGILGKGPDLEHTIHPTKIPATLFGRNEFSPDITTNAVFCGVGTNAALNSNGELFTWGKNRSSCLGLGDWRNQFFPMRVNCGAEVTKISLGIDHSCALAKPWI